MNLDLEASSDAAFDRVRAVDALVEDQLVYKEAVVLLAIALLLLLREVWLA